MPIIAFQHSDFGGLGRLGMTFRDHGFSISVRRPDLPTSKSNAGIPTDLDDVQGVIILGGPQNVTDIASLPWMQAQAAFIKDAHDAKLPVIGICLGAQLIAHCLGGTVAPRAKPAAGFRDTKVTIPGQTETMMAGIPWTSKLFYCCGQEITQPPAGAMILAANSDTKVQAFRVGIRTYAFMFHFEYDQNMMNADLNASRTIVEGAGLTQGEIKVQIDSDYANAARIADRLCINLATYLFPAVARLV